MKKRTLALLIAFVLLMIADIPAAAITDGELDGDNHPQVVLLLIEEDGEPAWRCSATMLSPTVVLTAGHCTGEPGEFSGMRIFTESDVEYGNNNYPFKSRRTSVEVKEWFSHPAYTDSAFFLHDVGVVILKKPYYPEGNKKYDNWGVLPEANQLDEYGTERGQQDIYFTAVGYGLQESFPLAAAWKENNERVRYVAWPKLNQINAPGFTGDFSLLLSNNHKTGGTCFGDSGGPNFIGDSNVIAGVTSYGLNGNCAGTGGVFRMDRQNVLDFVAPFLQ